MGLTSRREERKGDCGLFDFDGFYNLDLEMEIDLICIDEGLRFEEKKMKLENSNSDCGLIVVSFGKEY